MNEETKKIYMSIFENQLKEREPLTTEDINSLKGKTWLERQPTEGMKLVFFFDKKYQGNVNNISTWKLDLEMVSLPEEIDNFIARYVYDYTSSKFPIFQNRFNFSS